MANQPDLLERIAARTGIDTAVAEDVLVTLVESLALGEKPERPSEGIPPYFDRYVTVQLSHLGQQIAQSRVEMDRRFDEVATDMNRRFDEVATDMNRRFGEVDRRLGEVATDMNRRFGEIDRRLGELRVEMDRRFGEVDRRFGEVDRHFGELRVEMDRRFGEVDRRFDRLERWFFAVGIPIILGILAIIIKVFFGTPTP